MAMQDGPSGLTCGCWIPMGACKAVCFSHTHTHIFLLLRSHTPNHHHHHSNRRSTIPAPRS